MSASGGAAPPPGDTARYTLELRYTAWGVEGMLSRDGMAEPEPFSGWLDLLRLLEATPSPERGTSVPGVSLTRDPK
jgi:hypothetical protein